MGEGFVDFVSEVADVDFDGVGEDVGVVVPDVGDDLFFGDDLVFVAEEVFEEGEFFVGELDGCFCSFDFEGFGVEL